MYFFCYFHFDNIILKIFCQHFFSNLLTIFYYFDNIILKIYDFKKGFTGYVEELIGEYELPTSIFYYIFNIKWGVPRS